MAVEMLILHRYHSVIIETRYDTDVIQENCLTNCYRIASVLT